MTKEEREDRIAFAVPAAAMAAKAAVAKAALASKAAVAKAALTSKASAAKIALSSKSAALKSNVSKRVATRVGQLDARAAKAEQALEAHWSPMLALIPLAISAFALAHNYLMNSKAPSNWASSTLHAVSGVGLALSTLVLLAHSKRLSSWKSRMPLMLVATVLLVVSAFQTNLLYAEELHESYPLSSAISAESIGFASAAIVATIYALAAPASFQMASGGLDALSTVAGIVLNVLVAVASAAAYYSTPDPDRSMSSVVFWLANIVSMLAAQSLFGFRMFTIVKTFKMKYASSGMASLFWD